MDLGDQFLATAAPVQGRATLNFAGQLVDSINTQSFFVTANISENATMEATCAARIASVGSFTLNDLNTAAGSFPFVSDLITLKPTIEELMVASNDRAPANIMQ